MQILSFFLESNVQIINRIDNYDTVGINTLHDLYHDVFGYCNASARIRLNGAKAMEEYSRTSACRAVLVKADVEAVLILVFVINDVLTVLHIEIRIIVDVYHLVVVHAVTHVS